MAPASARGSQRGSDGQALEADLRRSGPEGLEEASVPASEQLSAAGAHARAAGPPRGPGAIVALQRAAGNQAVTRLLAAGMPARHAPESQDSAQAVHDEAVAALGVESAAHTPTLFGRRAPGERLSGSERRSEPESPGGRRANLFRALVQRYTTTDSLLTNVASVVGLDEKAKELTGAVTFESSGFAANVGGPLSITKDASNLIIKSQEYTASGTVKASGPKASVGNYQVGFLQTVYESSRSFYYEPDDSAPGLLARIVPVLFGERKKQSDTLSTAPVRDGDAGQRPWYGMETVSDFDKADTSTKGADMSDTPGTHNPWTLGAGDKQQHLVKTDGKDRFRSWLAVKDKATDQALLLNNADWEVDYSTTVAFNKAAPASSVVTPAAGSGSKVTSRAEGPGMKSALHNDPVANDVATMVDGLW